MEFVASSRWRLKGELWGQRCPQEKSSTGKPGVDAIHISSILPFGHILLIAGSVVGMAAWLEDLTQHIIISESI